MSETAVEMVECTLSGASIEKEKAIEYTIKETGEVRYVEPQTVAPVALKTLETPFANILLEQIALNDEAFRETIKLRQIAIAKSQGIQEGANTVLKKIKEVAEKQGVDIDTVFSEAFPAPETAAKEEEEEEVSKETPATVAH